MFFSEKSIDEKANQNKKRPVVLTGRSEKDYRKRKYQSRW